MAPLYDEQAREPLFGRDNTDANSEDGNVRKKDLTMNRILIIVTLCGLVALSIFFQMEQIQLTQQLKKDESTILQLVAKIESQETVIERFNQSVSNSDVLKRLSRMEEDFNDSETELKEKLTETVNYVNDQLNNTVHLLDNTVKEAEAEITNQVQTVKKDFEQYAIRTEDQFSMENSFMVYQLAGTFTLLSCLISMWHMTAHLRKYNQPVIQRKILAILWMSPIYAITSWFSLVFHQAEGYLAIVKDAYEAYIIYQFLSFCIAVLGKGDRAAVVDLLARRADHLTPPFRLFFCCRPDPYENDHQLADAILLQCQFFAMQFVFFRPVTTIARVVLAQYEYYGPWGAEGPNDWRAPQFYVTLIQNLSIFIAFTGLLKFYHAVDKDLEWCRPFAKFMCIKGVVFMTFWQGLAISLLAEATDFGGSDGENWAMSAQNFLICLEMLLFSIAHFYCFPTEEWEEGYRANFNKSKFGDSIALGDFFADLKLLMKGNKKRAKKKKKQPSQPTVPEEDDADLDDSDTVEEIDGFDEDEGGDVESGGGSESVSSTSYSATSDLAANATSLEDQDLANVLLDTSGTDSAEMEEARNRILRSGFLNDMLFITPSNRVTFEESDYPGNSEGASAVSTYGAIGGTPNQVDAPSEQTSLLSKAQPVSTTPLRPSIFTTLGEISEREYQLEEDEELIFRRESEISEEENERKKAKDY